MFKPSAKSKEIQELLGINYVLHGRDPKHGLDCYGALKEVYRILNIDLPDRDKIYSAEEGGKNWIKLKEPEDYAVAIIDTGKILHAGVVIPDFENDKKSYFLLHATMDSGITLERLPQVKNILYYVQYKEGSGEINLPEVEKGWRDILGLIVSVASIFVPGMIGLHGIAAALTSIAISTIGGMVINKLCPLKTPETPTVGGYSGVLGESNAYSWNGAVNSRKQGTIKSQILGTMLVGGQVLSEHVWTSGMGIDYLDILLSPSNGLVSDISKIYLNDTDITNFPEAFYEKRVGSDFQTPIQFFYEYYTQYPSQILVPYLSSVELDAKATVIAVKDIAANVFSFSITAPSGIYYTDQNNKLLPGSVQYKIQGFYDAGAGLAWNDLKVPFLTTPSYTVIHRIGTGFYHADDPAKTNMFRLKNTPTAGTKNYINFMGRHLQKGQNFILYTKVGGIYRTLYCTEASPDMTKWVASYAYSYEARVLGANGKSYSATYAAYMSSGTTEPDWTTAEDPGSIVIDHPGATQITWEEDEAWLVFKAYSDSSRTTPYTTIPDSGATVEYYLYSDAAVSPSPANEKFSRYTTLGFRTDFVAGGGTTLLINSIKFKLRAFSSIDNAPAYYWLRFKVWIRDTGSTVWKLVNIYEAGDYNTPGYAYYDKEVTVDIPIYDSSKNYDVTVEVSDCAFIPGTLDLNCNIFSIEDLSIEWIATDLTDTSPTQTFTITGDGNIPSTQVSQSIKIYTDNHSGITKFRLYRITPESLNTSTQNKIYLKYYNEGYAPYKFTNPASEDNAFSYPNNALLGLRIKATDRLSGSKPTITMLVSSPPVVIPTTSIAFIKSDLPTPVPDTSDRVVFGTPIRKLQRVILDSVIADPVYPAKDNGRWLVLMGSYYTGYADGNHVLSKPSYKVATWEAFDPLDLVLLHFNGLSTWLDNTGYTGFVPGVPFYTHNNSQRSVARMKFDDSSMYNPDNSSYLTTGGDIDLTLGTDDMLLELWIRPDASMIGTAFSLLEQNVADANNYWKFGYDGTKIFFIQKDGGGTTINKSFAYTVVANTWVHLVFTRFDANTIKFYINGVSQNFTGAGSAGFSFGFNKTLQIGNGFVGYIDEVRISNKTYFYDNFPVETMRYIGGGENMFYLEAHGIDLYSITNYPTRGEIYHFLASTCVNDSLAWNIAKLLISGSRGRITEAQIDWTSFLTFDTWNEDTTTWDGTDTPISAETRNKLNACIDYQVDLWKLCTGLALLGRGYLHVTADGYYKIMIDKAGTSLLVFGEGNSKECVTDYIPKLGRKNVLTASFVNVQSGYQQEDISMEDIQGTEVPDIQSLGMQVGVTSRNQLQRQLMFLLMQNRNINSAVNFKSFFNSLGVEVGDIPYMQGRSLNDPVGGRCTYNVGTETSTTKLLIRGDGSAGDIRIFDECRNVITPTGNVIYSSENHLFAEDDTSLRVLPMQGLSIPDSDAFYFGTNDWTIDFWVNFAENRTGIGEIDIFKQEQDANNYFKIYFLGTGIGFKLVIGGVTKANYNFILGVQTLDTWYHFAVTRVFADLDLYLHLDGIKQTWNVLMALGNYSIPNLSSVIDLLKFDENAGIAFFADLRITKAEAKHTSLDFTVVTEHLQMPNVVVDQEIDPVDATTTYLLKIWSNNSSIYSWSGYLYGKTNRFPVPTSFADTGLYECAYVVMKANATKTKYRILEIKRNLTDFTSTLSGLEYADACYVHD